jgi:hypothetical protein
MYFILKKELYKQYNLSKKELLFVTAASVETKKIEAEIEINFNYNQIWNKS